MVRFPSVQSASRRPAIGSPLQTSRRLLRRLADENVTLTRELHELRCLRRLAREHLSAGLPNRRRFAERLTEELSRWTAAGGRPGSIVIVDVEDDAPLKAGSPQRLNHDVLRDVAEMVKTGLRTEDICCRTRGGEFLILLSDTDASGARMVIARLRAAAMRAGARRNIPASLIAGASSWPTDGCDARTLFAKAAAALRTEKCRLDRLSRRRRPRSGGKLSVVK